MPFICPECNQNYTTSNSLNVHIGACHPITLIGTLTEDGNGLLLRARKMNDAGQSPRRTTGTTQTANTAYSSTVAKRRGRAVDIETETSSALSGSLPEPVARSSLNHIPLASARLPPPGPLSSMQRDTGYLSRRMSFSPHPPSESTRSEMDFESLRMPRVSSEFAPSFGHNHEYVSESKADNISAYGSCDISWSDYCPYPDEDDASNESTGLSDEVSNLQCEDEEQMWSRRNTSAFVLESIQPHNPSPPISRAPSSLTHHDVISPIHSLFDCTLDRHSTPPVSAPGFRGSTPGDRKFAESLLSNTRGNTPSPGSPSETGFRISDSKAIHLLLSGRPCDEAGLFLPYGFAPRSQAPTDSSCKWSPFQSQLQFESTELILQRLRLSPDAANELISMWRASLLSRSPVDPDSGPALFANYGELIRKIDSITMGAIPWETAEFTYVGLEDHCAPWMDEINTLHFRNAKKVVHNILASLRSGTFDVAPYKEFDEKGKRIYSNYFSGEHCWTEADKIALDPKTHGAMMVPISLGLLSETISVANGQTDYCALFVSIGNLHNNVRRADPNAVALLALLPIPKADERQRSKEFETFRSQLKHRCIEKILSGLRQEMTQPEVFSCGDGYLRRVIYSIGAHVVDYAGGLEIGGVLDGWCSNCILNPAQFGKFKCTDKVIYRKRGLTAEVATTEGHGVDTGIVPYTHMLCRADIAEVLTPDIHHQLINEGFCNYLLASVEAYFSKEFNESNGNSYLDELNRRIAIVPLFPGLQRYPQGLRTKSDFTDLIKILLPCLPGLVPNEFILAIRYFIDFYHLIHRPVLGEGTMSAIKKVLGQYHKYRGIFKSAGVVKNFRSPQQHMLFHYPNLIRQFGALSGLSPSFTESKHVKAVKELWGDSDKSHSLQQILTTIERLEKLKALRVYYEKLGNLDPETTGPARYLDDSGKDDQDSFAAALDSPAMRNSRVLFPSRSQAGYPENPEEIANLIEVQDFLTLIRLLLFTDIYSSVPPEGIPAEFYPLEFLATCIKIKVFHSAMVMYYAPTDPSGVGGMRQEVIIANPKWQTDEARYDCVYVALPSNLSGHTTEIRVARVKLFFSFTLNGFLHRCVLNQWYSKLHEDTDDKLGMWEVSADIVTHGKPAYSIEFVDSIIRGAHLIPAFGKFFTPKSHDHTSTLDHYNTFYLNKYIDHHAFDQLHNL